MFYVLLYVTLCPFYFCNIPDGEKKLVALLSLSSWRLVIVVWLFLAVPWVCLQYMMVVFSDHTHLLFLYSRLKSYINFSQLFGYALISSEPRGNASCKSLSKDLKRVLSRDMRFPTMWCVRPANPQISLRIYAV